MYKIENNEIDNIIAAWKAKNFHLFIEEEDRSYFVNTLSISFCPFLATIIRSPRRN